MFIAGSIPKNLGIGIDWESIFFMAKKNRFSIPKSLNRPSSSSRGSEDVKVATGLGLAGVAVAAHVQDLV